VQLAGLVDYAQQLLIQLVGTLQPKADQAQLMESNTIYFGSTNLRRMTKTKLKIKNQNMKVFETSKVIA